METNQTIDGIQFGSMLRAGAAELRKSVEEINDLNVFPIPDGDTGSNMLLTMMGGVDALQGDSDDISSVSRMAADGMLLAARGNSGVILSQLFDGIAKGLEGEKTASADILSKAFRSGVCAAYKAVLTPVEGTILTVAKCATENAENSPKDSPKSFLANYIAEAKKTLDRTPEMLPVLKKAGVIDSGGAGLVRILEGMHKALGGDYIFTEIPNEERKENGIDFNKFTENSILTYGYCTELLLRLQSAKTNIDDFDVKLITDYLQTVGDSVVCFKNGSAVKIHVHTMTPDKVLAFAQQYGEFLTVKIENMSLQHNNTVANNNEPTQDESTPKKKYGVVAVLQGDGIKEMFNERGIDCIVDGGQSMNPSAEDFIHAFSQISAEHIFVLPNNSNVVMAAEQAAKMYTKADILVLPSKTVGEGYAALSMMNPDEPNVETLAEDMKEAMTGVATAEISHCIRDARMDGTELHVGDYIGVCKKELLAASADRLETAKKTVDVLGMSSYDICIVIVGVDANEEEAMQLSSYIQASYRGKEAYIVNGRQDIYDYILVLQ